MSEYSAGQKAKAVNRLRYKNSAIDEVDARLLRLLEADSRTSLAELARVLGMSPPSVAERLKRLEEGGVIRRFTVDVSVAALGTGDDCFLARVHVRSVDDLERLIDRITPFAQTNTSIIQSSPVRRRLPPLNGESTASRA
jgi:Lrp/AsnC family leucine-responsive transcriptional regulator